MLHLKTFNSDRGFGVLIIVGIIAALMVAGGIAYVATDGFGMSGSSNDSSDDAGDAHADHMNHSSSPADLIAQAISGGDTIKCSYTIPQEAGDGTAETYIKDSDTFAVNTTYVQNGQTVNGHMLGDAGKTYIWEEGSDQGLIFESTADESLTEAESDGNFNPAELEQIAREGSGSDQIADINCEHAGNVDDSMFQLPSGVDFKDFSTAFGN